MHMNGAYFKKYAGGRKDKFGSVYLLKTIYHLNIKGYVREDETCFGADNY